MLCVLLAVVFAQDKQDETVSDLEGAESVSPQWGYGGFYPRLGGGGYGPGWGPSGGTVLLLLFYYFGMPVCLQTKY